MLGSIQKAFLQSKEDILVRTKVGAIISITALFLMVILFCTEFGHYISTNVRTTMTVDATDLDKIPVNFSIVFDSLKCVDTNIDIEDQAGTNEHLFPLVKKTPYVPQYLLDAEPKKYARVTTDNATGCRISGRVFISKVPGSIHVALGEHAAPDSQRHQFSMSQLKQFNSTHTVEEFSIGDAYPGRIDPLTHERRVARGISQFQYFLKVVPTEFVPVSGDKMVSYQYGLTEHENKSDATSRRFPLPGVWFNYEFAPLQMNQIEYRRTIFQFITSVLAVLGGCFTVFGLLDTFVYQSQKLLKKQS
eukprot:TRINITY_DN774212_c0_g1_i1.p1 TRINITY_DN774212_c0_g1~~TRINITY_DN774212_c0_g1_i1.p1  ORF type:complete len:304 (-),score=69.71 TRINITY_DN774212_c0_g1_i1:412-1323(-)